MFKSDEDTLACGERFEILRRIGAGGMGVVYEAFDREQRSRIALKTLPHADPTALYRFKQEFRNLAGIAHPNLATLYELFAVDESWFFTMEFIDGRNFLDYVRAGPGSPQRPAPDGASDSKTYTLHDEPDQFVTDRPIRTAEQFARLRNALRQLAEAIHVLHAADKVHRDIKPSNVLVTSDGRAVLLDFGLTIPVKEATEKNVIGTVGYMSPEQCAAQPLGPKSDWYSVGCMLYKALTGRLPFEGTTAEVIAAKRSLDAPAPRAIAADVPLDLDQLCSDLLQRDLSQRPGDEQILRRLGVQASAEILAEQVSLVGRRKHIEIMASALQTVREGCAVALFLHGGSGEGKTYLVERFIETVAAPSGAVVLSGRCYEPEAVPYKALDSLIDSLAQYMREHSDIAEQIVPRDARALTRLFPVLLTVPSLAGAPQRALNRASDQEVRRRAAGALRELLGRLADRVPVVLCIDDLQWGDLDSGNILADLLRGADVPLALFIGVYRSEYATSSPILQLLIESSGDAEGAERRDLPLGPLSHADASTLAAELLHDDGAMIDAIARESGGLPYFIHELVRFVRGGADIRAGVPIALEEVLARRVAGLPSASRSLLETIALAGRPIRQADAFEAAGVMGDATAAALLRSGHLVRSSGPGGNDLIELYHDRIRETLLARMEPAHRKECHRRLAETLQSSRGGDDEMLAVQFHGAEQFEKAAHYYADAARQAAEALAFEHAADLDRQSLQLRSPDDRAIHGLRVHLADALANAGRSVEAAAEYEAALAGAHPFEAVELRRRSAYQYCISGHLDQGMAAMQRLLMQLGMRIPTGSVAIIASLLRNRLRLWLRGLKFRERKESEIEPALLSQIDVVWSAATGIAMNDYIAAAALNTHGLILSLGSGEPYRIARALSLAAGHAANEGRKSAANKLIAVAEKVTERCGHPHAIGLLALIRGIQQFAIGKWATAVPLVDEADAILRERCTGVTWELDTGHAIAMWALIYMGEFAEMGRRCAVLLNEAEQRGNLFAYANFGTFHQPHALLAADDPRGAREFLHASRDRWRTSAFYLQDLTAVMTESLIDTYQGDGAAGYQRYVAAARKVRSSLLLRSQVVRMLYMHFRARAALAGAVHGSRPDLLRAAEADAKRIAREKVPWSVPYARVLFGAAAVVRGDHERAVALLRKSAEEFDGVHMRSHAASARRLLGELIGGSEGQQLIADADVWFAAHGVRNGRAMSRFHVGAVR
jgi:serine/threonine protein kinase